MKLSFSNFFTTVFSVCILLFAFSCAEDEVTGCTDPDAENYNVNAVTDSGNCTYASDDLIGTYLGVSECNGSLTNPGFNSSSLNFAVSKAATGGANDVDVSFSFESVPFVFSGVVTGDVLVLDDEIMNVSYPNPADPTSTIMVNVEGAATMTYFDDDMTLDCPNLVLKIKSANTGATIQEGACTIIGTKQ